MKPTSGITGHCTWRFSISCARKMSMRRPQVIIIFVDRDEHVNRVLPTLKEMAGHRLIVRENVVLEQGNLD